jgi:hypothetical protein
MGTLERTETLTHRIGSNGRISVKTITGALRVRGIEGEEARLTVTYRIRAADHIAAERALETGRVIVDRGPGSLEVETAERRLSTGLAWLFGGARVSANISIDVPWGTKVRYETMSGSIEAVALVGDQKYRSVSGDIRLWSLGGLVEAGSISGSITLDQGGDVRLRANTVSGGIKVRARRFHGLALSTTSGGIAVVGELDPSGDHRTESISGSVELTPLSGVTAELRAISGSIHSDVEHRLEGGRGYWRSIVGDGRATFKVNSTSGSLRILAERPGDRVVAATAPAQPSSPAAQASASGAPHVNPAVPAASPSTAPADGRGLEETGETWNPEETGDAAEDLAQDEELSVLQALERGEIGVDEAAERLDRSRR